MADPYSIEEIRGAVARGWCADKNRNKEMDADLAEAIAQEILRMLRVGVPTLAKAIADEIRREREAER
jgi:hypothetical protein